MNEDRRGWIPELDGLRAIAALVVVLAHHDPAPYEPAGWSAYGVLTGIRLIVPGALGVVFFFTLSAFLLTYLGRREWQRTGGFDLRSFYVRRALRIWPLYGVSVLAGLLLARQNTWLWDHLWLWALFISNWSLVLSGWAGHVNRAPVSFDVLWSIAVEEQFYLLFPLLLVAALASRRAALAVVVGLFVGCAVLRWASLRAPYVLGAWDPAMAWNQMYYATVTYVDTFAAGAVAGWLVAGSDGRWARVLSRRGIGWLVALAALSVGLAWRSQPWYPDELFRSVVLTWTGLVFATVLLWVTANGRARLSAVLRSRPLRVLGALSYGIYVWHPFSDALTRPWLTSLSLPTDLKLVVMLAVYVGVTVALAGLSYVLVERPCLRLKDRLVRPGHPRAVPA